MRRRWVGLIVIMNLCLMTAGCGTTAGGAAAGDAQAAEDAQAALTEEPETEDSTLEQTEEPEAEERTSAQSEEPEEEERTAEQTKVTEERPEDTAGDLEEAAEEEEDMENAQAEELQRVTYADGFYYERISDALLDYITGISYPELAAGESVEITPEDLRYVHVLHYDFDAEVAEGELICNASIAQDLVEIFYELYENEYQIEQIHLVDEYGGDDVASMTANNTSCFNYRNVANSSSLSKHALGLAVDINPLYNPYLTYNSDGSLNCSPEAGWPYADRSADFPHKINTSDLCYQLFTEHGFTWGGSWNSSKDYQHFQKG